MLPEDWSTIQSKELELDLIHPHTFWGAGKVVFQYIRQSIIMGEIYPHDAELDIFLSSVRFERGTII